MKFADEFRDPAAARALVKSITELAGDGEYKFMEVCGGHTHTIYRHGLEHLLPRSIELVHGPGCPVCVIPMGRVDDAIWLAGQPDVIFTTFGDMMRVPGSDGSLLEAKARGCRRPLRVLAARRAQDSGRQPRQAGRLLRGRLRDHRAVHGGHAGRAKELGVANFSVFCNHVTIVPPIKAILDSPDLRMDGFIGPGHVSTVVGNRPYRFVPEVYGKPIVVAGFEPLDILQSVYMLLAQLREGRCEVENQYSRVVRDEGNPRGARAARRGLRAATAFRVARPRGSSARARSSSTPRTPSSTRSCGTRCRGPGRRPEGLPVRRGAEGRDQAVGVQGVRHRVHAGDPDRHLHGLARGSLRGVLQLRPPAQGDGGARRPSAGGPPVADEPLAGKAGERLFARYAYAPEPPGLLRARRLGRAGRAGVDRTHRRRRAVDRQQVLRRLALSLRAGRARGDRRPARRAGGAGLLDGVFAA